MKVKNVVFALAITGLISTQAYAADARVEDASGTVTQAEFSDAEMQTLFEPSSSPMQLASLSGKEMKETEGAVIWLPALYWGLRLSPYIPSIGVALAHQAPRLGATINNMRYR